jgi:orotate phosphoribosyltransferase
MSDKAQELTHALNELEDSVKVPSSSEDLLSKLFRFQSAVSSGLEHASEHDFVRAWLARALTTDFLRYSIEDDYVDIDEGLVRTVQRALGTIAASQRHGWDEISKALGVLRQLAKVKPEVADVVEVRTMFEGRACRFVASLARANAPGIPVSNERQFLVPILEQSVTHPDYSQSVLRAFASALERYRTTLDVDCLCFIEKTAGPVGALTLASGLVVELGLPACIYRDDYWLGRAKVSGFQPSAKHRVAIVYDLVVSGDGVKHVASALSKSHNVNVVAAVVLSGFESRESVKLDDGREISLRAILWQDELQTEIEQIRQRTKLITPHLSLLANGLEDASSRRVRVKRNEPQWKSSLNHYERSELRALRFDSVDEIDRAIDIIWTMPELLGVPNESPEGLTLIVPAGATEYFKDAGLAVNVDHLLDFSDLSAAELAECRRHYGM